MDFLSAEPLLNGKPARRVVRNGRTWLVAPVAMIVDGVLHGSQGAGYYPPAETRRAAPLWDGVPITVNHPFDPTTGAPLSAKDAGVLERQGIGTVFNPDWNGKLGAEGWFDEELTKNKAPKLLTALEKGEAFELSTGLFLNRVPVKGSFNGAPYDWEARDHRPDHLAVLVDQTGACSRAMGCGVNMNAEPSDRVDPDKACEILHDGTANGATLTDAQRKMFGAACSEVSNAEPEKKHTIWRWLGETLGVLNAATPNHPATGKFHPRKTIAGEHAKKGAADGIPGDLPDPKVAAAAQEGFACECGKPDCDECKADNANPEGCNQHTGPGCGGEGVRDTHFGGPPRVKAAFKEIEQGPLSYIADKPHDEAAAEIPKIRAIHEKQLETLKKIAEGKAMPADADERDWRYEESRAGKQMLASEWASKLAVPQKEMYLAGIARTEKALGVIRKYREGVIKKKSQQTENERPNEEDIAMTRADTIKHLVANCDCWKGGEAALNGLTDEQLKKLMEQNARMRTLELTGNALLTVVKERGAPADLPIDRVPEFVRNAFPPPKKGKKVDPEEEGDDEEEDMAENKRKPYDEWMAAAPVEIQNFVTTAIEVTRQAQADLVAKLTANIADEGAKKAAQAAYAKMDYRDLKAISASMPGVQNYALNLLPYFFGSQGGPRETPRQTTNEEPDLLDVPTINFAELSKERAKERASA